MADRAIQLFSRIAFGTASVVLMILSLALVAYAGVDLYDNATRSPDGFGDALLSAISYVVIAMAVFDLAKYFVEEEVVRGREMRLASEARRSLTKFISTISIAVFIEALVTVVRVSKRDVDQMIYPNILLLTAIIIVIGLGIYQRLSVTVERQDKAPEKQQ